MWEMNEMQKEMSEAFSRNYDIDVTDADLDAELDEIDYQNQVDLNANELTAPNKKVILSKKEEDEMELENMMK
jgi:RAB protein geranylgeranyltransferase component A